MFPYYLSSFGKKYYSMFMWTCFTVVFRDSFFNKIRFYFEIIVESQAVVRNNTKRSHVPFTQVSLVVISCKIIVQYYNQNVDIDTAKIQNSFTIKDSSVCSPLMATHPLPWPLTTTNMFSVSIIMSLQECYVYMELYRVAFGNCLFSFITIPWRSIQVVACIDSLFFFLLSTPHYP